MSSDTKKEKHANALKRFKFHFTMGLILAATMGLASVYIEKLVPPDLFQDWMLWTCWGLFALGLTYALGYLLIFGMKFLAPKFRTLAIPFIYYEYMRDMPLEIIKGKVTHKGNRIIAYYMGKNRMVLVKEVRVESGDGNKTIVADSSFCGPKNLENMKEMLDGVKAPRLAVDMNKLKAAISAWNKEEELIEKAEVADFLWNHSRPLFELDAKEPEDHQRIMDAMILLWNSPKHSSKQRREMLQLAIWWALKRDFMKGLDKLTPFKLFMETQIKNPSR